MKHQAEVSLKITSWTCWTNTAKYWSAHYSRSTCKSNCIEQKFSFNLNPVLAPVSANLCSQPIMSSQQWAVKSRTSQVSKHTTHAHSPHSANSFCLLQNKKGLFWSPASTREQSIGGVRNHWLKLFTFPRSERAYSSLWLLCILLSAEAPPHCITSVHGKEKREINVTMI